MTRSLVLDVEVTLENFALQADVDTDVTRLSFFGPSGAGKTMLLDCLAGTRTPDTGRIVFGDRVFFDGEEGVALPPEERDVGYMMQSAPLFPHLDVRGNITYSGQLRIDDDRARTILDILDIEDLLSRDVSGLSGGEERRVALARTLFSDPDLLLLDEPLTGLNQSLRARILPFLRKTVERLQLPVVHVSHRPEEVLALSHDVICIHDGQTEEKQSDAQFIRSRGKGGEAVPDERNYIPAVVTGEAGGRGLLPAETEQGTTVRIPGRSDLAVEDPVIVSFDPGNVILARHSAGAFSPRNQWTCTIRNQRSYDGVVILELETGSGERFRARVTQETAEEMELTDGTEVTAMVKTHALQVYPA